MANWIVNIIGDVNGTDWEVSVVRADYNHGIASYGWFDERKLMISSSVPSTRWPLAPGIGLLMVEIASKYAKHLNESIGDEPFSRFLWEVKRD